MQPGSYGSLHANNLAAANSGWRALASLCAKCCVRRVEVVARQLQDLPARFPKKLNREAIIARVAELHEWARSQQLGELATLLELPANASKG